MATKLKIKLPPIRIMGCRAFPPAHVSKILFIISVSASPAVIPLDTLTTIDARHSHTLAGIGANYCGVLGAGCTLCG